MNEKSADGLADEVMKNTKVLVEVELNEGMIHNNLVSAIEGGSNYWAEISVGKHEPGWANYFTATFLVIEESDETKGALHGKKYRLNRDKIRSGLKVLATKYPHHFYDILKEDGDTTTGDVLVQCALFGDIVYG
jgi:hypothetical protein